MIGPKLQRLRSRGSAQVSSVAFARQNDTLKWWQRAVIYEIAVISFQDSDGNGKGDLQGLIDRIDYLEWLGIDAVWLTPIYPSPQGCSTLFTESS